jgi:prepilin-type N-terminal cleavage/methylation domain-containing protein
MDDRGFTLLELLVAGAIGSVVLLGIGGYYLSTLRFYDQSSSQAFLQRQASLAIEEMARQIRPANALTRGVCNADPNALQVTNSLGVFCFYRNGSQLSEDRPGGTANLLSGSPVPLTVTSFTSLLTPASSGATRATISFQLSDNVQNSMTFQTDLSRRN